MDFQRKLLIVLICPVAFMTACNRSRNAPVIPQTTTAANLVQGSSKPTSTLASDDSAGILQLPNGAKFATTLYELKVIGQLKTQRKLPYNILSGRGCQECDANTSIYIHSPSDGPMKNEGEQRRFSYPGKETDYENGSFLSEARMFFGDCLPRRPNAVVWFMRFLGEDKQWHESVFLVEVKDDHLVSQEFRSDLPKLSEAEDAVRTGQCQEVPGIDGPSEP